MYLFYGHDVMGVIIHLWPWRDISMGAIHTRVMFSMCACLQVFHMEIVAIHEIQLIIFKVQTHSIKLFWIWKLCRTTIFHILDFSMCVHPPHMSLIANRHKCGIPSTSIFFIRQLGPLCWSLRSRPNDSSSLEASMLRWRKKVLRVNPFHINTCRSST